MNKTIVVNGDVIDYILKYSKRAKSVRIVVKNDASVAVTIPYFAKESIAEKFVIEKSEWILKRINHCKKYGEQEKVIYTKDEIMMYKVLAKKLVEERLVYFNQFYNLRWNKISIKNTKSRWGSCSKKGNVNFNYKITLLPPHVADYIVVHELCHLGEFNHSKKFWGLVAKTIPNYLIIRVELRNVGLSL
jgi:predicted metal-dependent hydrolase